MKDKRAPKRRLKWIAALMLLVALACVFAAYVETYYRADPSANEWLVSDESVRVVSTDYGWLFDGPSDESALIFYPGAKVDEAAYAPLMRQLAASGMDVCLVRMPFHLAILGINRADAAMRAHDYDNWYIGGHSLGGYCATQYASRHGDRLRGVILLAAYPAKPMGDDLDALFIYGSQDGVLNRERYAEGLQYTPKATEHIIEGGNHAGFGLYGPQKGDGAASIPADAQIQETVRAITAWAAPGRDAASNDDH